MRIFLVGLVLALAGLGPALAQAPARSFGPPGGYEANPSRGRESIGDGSEREAGGGPGGDLTRERRLLAPGFALEQPPSPGLSGSGDLTRSGSD